MAAVTAAVLGGIGADGGGRPRESGDFVLMSQTIQAIGIVAIVVVPLLLFAAPGRRSPAARRTALAREATALRTREQGRQVPPQHADRPPSGRAPRSAPRGQDLRGGRTVVLYSEDPRA